MNYRAVAVGLTRDGHPVQCFGCHLTPVAKWAEEIVKRDNVPVEIWATKETLLRTELPPPKTLAEPPQAPTKEV